MPCKPRVRVSELSALAHRASVVPMKEPQAAAPEECSQGLSEEPGEEGCTLTVLYHSRRVLQTPECDHTRSGKDRQD